MLEETAVEVFKEVNNTPKENRTWTLAVILIFISFAVAITSFFVFQSQKSEAVQRAISAENELQSIQRLYVSEGKECPKLIQDAVDKNNLYWQAKFDNLEMTYSNKATRLETQINSLNRDADRLKNKVGL